MALALAIAFSCITSVSAQEIRPGAKPDISVNHNPAAEASFQEAMLHFNRGEYDDAAKFFSTLISLRPPHQYTTAAYVMAAKSYNALGEHDRAISLLKTFFDLYPSSNYRSDARYTLGESYLIGQRYLDAAIEFTAAKDSGAEPAVAARAQTLLEYLAGRRITYTDVQKLPSGAEDTRDELTYLIAEQMYRNGNFAGADSLVDTLMNRRPDTGFSRRALDLHRKIASGVNVKIGVLLPLLHDENVPSREQASDVLEGIQYALNRKRLVLPAGMNVTLEVKDSGKDIDLAKSQTAEFAAQKDVLAVIGPMFSSVAFACAPIANNGGLPLISPTANAVGIAATGPYMFQMNPDLAMHGRAIARYAVRDAGLKTLAIVTPTDESMRPLVKSFYDEALKLGARIVASELYENASEDFEEHCQNLRKIGVGGEAQVSIPGKLSADQMRSLLSAGVSQSTLDSLRRRKGTVGVISLLGPYGIQIADSLHFKVTYPAVNPRAFDRPVENIQAVFAPVVDPAGISVVLSQLTYYNIKTQILGSAEWYNTSILDGNKQNANGAIFCSDTFIDRGNPAIQEFGTGYFEASRKSPNRYSMFGYDAMDLLLESVLKGVTTRESLVRALTSVQNFHGVHTSISIDTTRVNSVLNILQYSKGSVKKLKEINGE